MTSSAGRLFIVATPIGNLEDFSPRAVATLTQADAILAEDTRHAKTLLQHFAIHRPLIALHQHNEAQRAPQLIERLQAGDCLALISDAGTPLISDPGLLLVKLAHQAGIIVTPIPGPCAWITALAAAGLPAHRFVFEGFPPRHSAARRAFFEARSAITVTWGFYEASHRIVETLTDMAAVLPEDRTIVIARELTKWHETILSGPLPALLQRILEEENQQKGEFVVIVAGAPESSAETLGDQARHTLRVLLRHHSLKQAVAIAHEITGARKKMLYQTALDWNIRITG